MIASHDSSGAAAAKGAEDGLVKLAILAVGGQGGGVLSDWLVHAAEACGYVAQATSVPGVAQRTGATIYSLEMMPRGEREPVLALMPFPGDVDIVVAAELMEAGRAIMRGLVTPDRTTLIASTHRILAVSEKIVPGRGLADERQVMEAARASARRLIAFDMQRIASETGSVISASLLGAIAGSGALPFPVTAYEEAICAAGRGVEASLQAFHRARAQAERGPAGEVVAASSSPVRLPMTPLEGPGREMERWRLLQSRLEGLPSGVHDLAQRGLAKVVDFQDTAYGSEYLDRLETVFERDKAAGGEQHDFALTLAAAKHVANAMVYDDVIRVADRKTRMSRFARIARELGTTEAQVVHLTEFMHPRAEEVVGMMPAALGRWIEARPRLFRRLDRLVNRGRRVRSDSIFWFTVLSGLAGMRRWRRRLLRHEREQALLNEWLNQALAMAVVNYSLAVEIMHCRRLIKGYSDTHARGRSKFDRVLAMVPVLAERTDGAEWLRRLREAALKDEEGTMLEGAIRTIEDFAGSGANPLPAPGPSE
jgi:indolepyruvate ferredoxin oxidoreductase beta subunit